jgi:hypothetical protein
MNPSEAENIKLSVESLSAFVEQFGEITDQERIALEYILELIYEASSPKRVI